MSCGRYRHAMTVQRPTETVGETGAAARTWATWKRIMGRVEDLAGREALAGERAAALGTVCVRLRYLPGLTSAMRLVYGDRTLEIAEVADRDGRRREMLLSCNEVR